MNKKIIILDRDGVINEDSPDFIKSPAEWRPIPGSLEKIAEFNRQGYRVVVATNQSGISRSLFGLKDLIAIHRKMHFACAEVGAHLDGIYFCPHTTADLCPCRKPQPGMLLQIAKDFNINLSKDALSIGDSWRDMEAAQAVNCPAILVRTGNGEETLKNHSFQNLTVFNDLASCTF